MLFLSSAKKSQGAVDRAVREVPWESRFDILKRREKPIYMSECIGTPRREYQKNVINGIRIHPTFNPFVKFNKARKYVYNNWPSRNFDEWSPHQCFVRGSRKKYNVPVDIFPYKDELGEWHPPKLSGRYRADIEKQYYINGLPWVWSSNFYSGTTHFHDNPPIGPKLWYRREYRKQRVHEAMKKMDELVLNYRKECRERRNLNWMNKVVWDLAGDEIASNYVKKPKHVMI